MKLSRSFAAVALFAACSAAPVMAATSWSTPAGSSDNITYSNGQTSHGLLTPDSPLVSSDGFLFTPSGFSSQDNGSASDTASFTVTAKPGRQIASISATLFGDWSILGNGTTDATGTLTLTNPANNSVVTKTFAFTGQTGHSDGDGKFSSNVITLPLGWHSANVSLSAGLTSTAEQGSTSFIQYKGGVVSIGTSAAAAAVPLPPAALAALPAIALAYVARRRMAKA